MDETTLENRLTRLETDIQYVGEMMDDLEERQASIEKLALSNATAWVGSMCLFDNTHMITASNLSGSGAGTLNVLQLDFTYATAEKYKFTFDETRGSYASVAKLDDSHVALAHAGTDNDGYLRIIEVTTR